MIFAFMITKTSRTFKNLATQRAVVTNLDLTVTIVYMNIQAWSVLQHFVTILALESWKQNRRYWYGGIKLWSDDCDCSGQILIFCDRATYGFSSYWQICNSCHSHSIPRLKIYHHHWSVLFCSVSSFKFSDISSRHPYALSICGNTRHL